MTNPTTRPSYLTHLQCADCGRSHNSDAEQHLCTACGGILLARYDLKTLAGQLSPEHIASRPWSEGLWRYAELLPAVSPERRVSLGEGSTPLLALEWLSAELGVRAWLKDEGRNPTGTFKARGAAVGVSRALMLGARTIALPTAGNAGAAWAAYGARADLHVVVAMPADAPALTQQQVRLYGATLHLVDGLINDAGAWVAAGVRREGWYDASTFKEPYRLEGKKTMGLEIAEQLGWQAPDVILYPAGGGVGLVGLWKAFDELRALGWLDDDAPPPRLVAVQSAGCAPVVRAWEEGASATRFWEGAHTIAAGLRVPAPLAGGLMLRALHNTGGTAIAVRDDEIVQAIGELARHGLWVCPEGAALLPAVRHLRANGWIRSGERVVLLNTGSGLLYWSGVASRQD
jgi:threonine synthase